MPDSNTQTILEVVADALERMAFISIELVAGRVPCPADAVLVRVPLWLPKQAAVEMIAPESFGALIAGNAMATGPDEPITVSQSHDALAEFLNILASALLLPSTAIVSAGRIVKGVPEVVHSVSSEEWDAFTTHEETALFDAEGSIVACRFIQGE